jgi:hypothetical protein
LGIEWAGLGIPEERLFARFFIQTDGVRYSCSQSVLQNRNRKSVKCLGGVGWGPVLTQVLKLDFDVAIPSQGAPISRADVQAFKDKIDTMVARATGLVKEGIPRDQLMSQLKTEDLGWHLSFTGNQLDSLYADLAGRR